MRSTYSQLLIKILLGLSEFLFLFFFFFLFNCLMNSTIKRFSKKIGSPPRPGPTLGCGGSVVVGVGLVGVCLVAVLFRFRKINLKMGSGKILGIYFREFLGC